MGFEIRSLSFSDGEAIPKEHTCNDTDTPPALCWSGAPAGVESYLLVVDDPDAPSGVFTHWVVYDIPGETGGIDLEILRDNSIKQGHNDFGRNGYGGPCPPKGHGRHRYFFKLYALEVQTLGLSNGASRGDVEKAVHGHIIGQCKFMGTYERR